MTIRDRLPDTEFRRFFWTGANTHNARLHAGTDLADFMRRNIAASPDANHYIIAHSHGGNVACYALRDDSLASRISGLVCLATPFIHVAPRSIMAGAAMLLETMPFLLSMALLFLGVYAFVLGQLLVGLLLVTLFYAAIAFGGAWMEQLIGRVLPALQHRQLVGLLTLPAKQPPATRMLCLRYEGDEAAHWLGIADRVGDAPFFAIARSSVVAKRSVAVAVALAPLLRGAKLLHNISDSAALLAIGVALVLTGIPALFAASHVLLLILPAFRIGAYFDHSVVDFLHTRVYVDGLPEREAGSSSCTTSVQRRRTTSWRERRWWRLALAHSFVYQEEEAILDICEWIVPTGCRDEPSPPNQS